MDGDTLLKCSQLHYTYKIPNDTCSICGWARKYNQHIFF